MKEELLHHIWKTKRIDFSDLKTTEGEIIKIQNFGVHNHNAGPDFLEAKATIGTTQWAGHIEIHINASDWMHHKHQKDKAYNNVILHVVYNNDKTIVNENGETIPTLEIKDRIPDNYIGDYTKLISSLNWIPCANQIKQINKDRIPFFLERLLVNRLLRKEDRIKAQLALTKNNWEEVLYKTLLKYFGLKVNGEAFESLTEVLPHGTLIKLGESVFQKESVLLGQAGLLTAKDDYTTQLANEYLHQKNKFRLRSMTGVEWKFARLRPANFPTLRLAQIAALYHQTPKLFAAVIQAKNVSELNNLLEIKTSPYWNTHYIPGKPSTEKKKKIGETTKKIILINAFIPLIFAYGQILQKEELKSKAVDLMFMINAESNSIIKRWKELGMKADSAGQSQALLELKNEYCDGLRCLECQIGQQLVFG